MTIDERARHELFLGCETALGPERAETLMALLPPVGWADVATKQDLAHLEERLQAQFEAMEARFMGELHRALNSQTKTLFFGIITVLTSLAALGVAFAR